MTESRSHLGNTEHVLIVYAKNTLGTVHVRDFNFTVSSKLSWYMYVEIHV